MDKVEHSGSELLDLIKQGSYFLRNYWLVIISFIIVILAINVYGFFVNEPHYYSHIVFHCKEINPVSLSELGQQLNSDVANTTTKQNDFTHLKNIALIKATSIDEATVKFSINFYENDTDFLKIESELMSYLMTTPFVAKEVSKKQASIKKKIENINQELINIQVFRKKVEALIDNQQYQSLGAINLYTNDIISLQNEAIALESDYKDIQPFEVLTKLKPLRFNSHVLVMKIVLSAILGFLLSIAYYVYKNIF